MDPIFSTTPTPTELGGQQNEVLYSMMKVIYRQSDADAGPATPVAGLTAPRYALPASGKVERLSCCCRISELLPLVKQLHDEARELRQAREVQRIAA